MITIKQTEQNGQGVFTAYEDGVEAGIMTYERTDEPAILIDHTEVYEGFKGRGIGKQLVEAGTNFAKSEGLRTILVCSFAKATAKRSNP